MNAFICLECARYEPIEPPSTPFARCPNCSVEMVLMRRDVGNRIAHRISQLLAKCETNQPKEQQSLGL